MKYYVNSEGVYLGGWDENPPEDAIEVPYPPEDARQVWQMPDGPWSVLPPQPYILPVYVIWMRMTDDEAEEFDSAISAASPLRLRKAFNTATNLTSGSELFLFVRNILINIFDETRADEIVAIPTSEDMSSNIELEM